MKKIHWITLTIGITIVLGIFAVPAITQTQPQAAPQAAAPIYVAVLDVAQVIKQHPVFVEQQAALKTQIDQAEGMFQKRQEAIAEQQKRLEASSLKPGSPEYVQAVEKIAAEVADFERDARAQQRRFALENSKIMYETYKDIKGIIGRFAVANGIAQVTDYREFEPNPAQPESVAEDMDQRLVWFNPSLNITTRIVQQVYAAHGRQMPAQATTPQMNR